jgi:hypothetical protein
MGWFNKEKKEIPARLGSTREIPSKIPELPSLPELPEFPYSQENDFPKEKLHQLPSFPNNSIGNKFSQHTIKEAMNGEEEDEEGFEANDFSREIGTRMMPKPVKQFSNRTIEEQERVPRVFKEAAQKVKEAEPIFVRIDKFEEGVRTFRRAKERISEIEKNLGEIKKIKYEEEQEMINWENEIQSIKKEIEKVSDEIFSKL